MLHLSALLPVLLAVLSFGTDPVVVRNLGSADGPVHFSLVTGTIVPDSLVADDNWDLRFDGINVAVNGPGRFMEVGFDALTEAPEDGYVSSGEGNVIPSGSGNGWYVYDPTYHVISAIPDRTIVVETAAGTFAKVEILDYYHSGSGDPRFYTFRFVVQPDGTRSF